MKLFNDETERYTEEALKIYSEANNAIGMIFKKYSKYPAREIASLLHHVVLDNECEVVLGKGLKKAKQNTS